MMGKENLKEGVLTGIAISLAIGIIVSIIFKPTFNSIIFILSLALLPGFFFMSLLHLYKLSKERISKVTRAKKFDWGIEMNLKKLQILHNRYYSMIQTVGILASASFLAMIIIAKDFPSWGTGHLIFFPISTILFITFLHLIFRWWLAMRSDYKLLQLHNLKE